VTVADIRRAVSAGLTSIEHIKRYTTLGTASDQGKTSGSLGSIVAASLLDAEPGAVGVPTFRAPYVPVSFALMAGRDRGALHDPVRTTPMHPWHVAHGAVFENVALWRRARVYPRPGETLDEAVMRECRAARTGVAVADVSTLGKIDVQGPDAGEFLNRVYANAFAKLPVGACRYGVMCTPDGMVFDDGVTSRLAENRFHMTTTTGNAAAVFDHLEEWLQTEWLDLRVRCTSVTEQWAVAAVVGARSRDVLRILAPALDVSSDAFPFMTWRDATLAGISARVFRISFSGELAYEINVPAWHGLALWEAVMAAGEPFGITPYGTEGIYVLRAEKGYPLIGQETDGSVSPVDLGLEWMVSKTKDFIGRRSLRRLTRRGRTGSSSSRSFPHIRTSGCLKAPSSSTTRRRRSRSLWSAMSRRAIGARPSADLRPRARQARPGADRRERLRAARRPHDRGDDPRRGAVRPQNRRRDGDGAPSEPDTKGDLPAGYVAAPARRGAFETAAATLPDGVRDVGFLAQVDLRADPADSALIQRLAGALGHRLATDPNRSSGDPDGRHALWLGPDEWRGIGQPGRVGDIEATLRTALADGPGA
jgi:glycine cleavage system aminomethyltransferase T